MRWPIFVRLCKVRADVSTTHALLLTFVVFYSIAAYRALASTDSQPGAAVLALDRQLAAHCEEHPLKHSDDRIDYTPVIMWAATTIFGSLPVIAFAQRMKPKRAAPASPLGIVWNVMRNLALLYATSALPLLPVYVIVQRPRNVPLLPSEINIGGWLQQIAAIFEIAHPCATDFVNLAHVWYLPVGLFAFMQPDSWRFLQWISVVCILAGGAELSHWVQPEEITCKRMTWVATYYAGPDFGSIPANADPSFVRSVFHLAYAAPVQMLYHLAGR